MKLHSIQNFLHFKNVEDNILCLDFIGRESYMYMYVIFLDDEYLSNVGIHTVSNGGQ